MNYLHFFNLKSIPFDKSSKGGFSYQSKSFNEAKARMDMVNQSGGIFFLYGEYGIGKSALLGQWAHSLPVNIKYVYLDYVNVQAYGILYQIAKGLSIAPSYSKVKLACSLKEYFAMQTDKPVILIDEAQDLAHESIDDIRMLTSQNFDNDAPFMLIFCGHNDFWAKLSRHKALKQRISFSYQLLPFSSKEASLYLKQRLTAAGSVNYPFTQPAEDEIFEFSGGVARKINKLATLSLMIAASTANNLIDQRIVQSAISELSKNQ